MYANLMEKNRANPYAQCSYCLYDHTECQCNGYDPAGNMRQHDMNILVHLPNGRMFVKYWPRRPEVGTVITDEYNGTHAVQSVTDLADKPFRLSGVEYTASVSVWVD